MPRKVRDSNLETRTARARLKASAKPVFRLIEPGLHLGYRRRTSGPGTWIVRRYAGDGRYTVQNLTTAENTPIVADDFSEPDGVIILSFAQAQERAKKQRLNVERAGPYTVENAMDNYVAWLESTRKSAKDTEYKVDAYIRPALGSTDVDKLTTDRIRKWLTDLGKQGRRIRTKKGTEPRHRELGKDDEAKRRRQATVNRVLTILKAGLNRAWREGKAASDAAWRRVEPFHSVDAARVLYLSMPETTRFINACAPDFRRIAQAGLLTGARWGQLCMLTAADFNPDSGTVTMRSRKGRGRVKVYSVVLSDEGVRCFIRACAGLNRSDLIFRRDDGEAWSHSHQLRPTKEACERAKIDPPIGFHGLRHTWASHAVMNGVPLLVVAKNLGHGDTRMVEKHYGHLAPSYIADAIRAGAPKFGFTSDMQVVALA